MNTTLRLRSLLAVGASATALMSAAPVLAAAAPAPAADNGTTMSQVIVTAEKRSANVQSVPIAVTAFTSKQRALIGINSVQDMTNFTPGLTYSSQLDRPVMRGLARSSNIYTADSSVGVYDNDLFTNSTFLVGRDDMIVDQVEILLGPQNTLYGRNAIGGIINTQSKRPSDSWNGEVRVAAGNFGYTKTEGTITGPLNEILPGLDFRLSYYDINQDKGYFTNVTGNKSTGGVVHEPYGEFQLRYKGDKDDIWFMAYDLAFNDDRGGPGALIGTPTVGPYDTALVDAGDTLFFNPNFAYASGSGFSFVNQNPAYAIDGVTPITPNIFIDPNGPVAGSTTGTVAGGNPSTRNIRTTALLTDTNIKVDAAYSFNFHWIHHFDGFDVKYVGGYSQYHYRLWTNDFLTGESSVNSYQLPLIPTAYVGAAGGNICNGVINATVPGACAPLTVRGGGGFTYFTNTDWWSHEINITSTGNGRFSWIAGGYYFNETDNNPETEFNRLQPQLAAGTWNVTTLGAIGNAATYFPSVAAYAFGLGPHPTTAIFNPSQANDYLLLDYQDRIQTLAGFFQGSWKFTDSIKFTGGIRYTYDNKRAQEEAKYIQFTNPNLAGLLGQYTPAIDITPVLVSYVKTPGVCSSVSFPTTGAWAGDAVRCLRGSGSAVTGTAELEYKPDNDTLAYVRYSRGYKAFALNSGYIGNTPETKPEFVNDFEGGYKRTLNHNFVIDLAAFYYDYSNDEVPLGVPQQTPAGPLSLTTYINIPKAYSTGVEMVAMWTPVRHLNLSLTYAFDYTNITADCKISSSGVANSACFIDPADPWAVARGAQPVGLATLIDGSGNKYTPFATIQGVTAYDKFQTIRGNPLPQAPRNKIAFNANYTWEFEPGNLTASASFVWKDNSYSSIFKRYYEEAPSWNQVDLRATWSGDHDKYELVFYVKNLLDSRGYDAAAGGQHVLQPQGGGGQVWDNSYDLTPPRLFGGEIHYKF